MAFIARLLPSAVTTPLPPLPPLEGAVNNSFVVSLLLAMLHYCACYGCQILLFTALSFMAAFRREMSSNRVYMRDREQRERARGSGPDAPPSRARLVILDQDVTDIDNLLEGAGHFCSGGALLTVAFSIWARVTIRSFASSSLQGGGPTAAGTSGASVGIASSAVGPSSSSHAGRGACMTSRDGPCGSDNSGPHQGEKNGDDDGSEGDEDGAFRSSHNRQHCRESAGQSTTVLELPPDSHIQVLSYLHPRDIVSFACVSAGAQSIVNEDSTAGDNGNATSVLLWKQLWKRDYAWIVTEWDVGKEALDRSMGQAEGTLGGNDSARSVMAKDESCHHRRMNPIFRHLESSVVDEKDANDSFSSSKQGLTADTFPSSHRRDTRMTMKDFYFTFGETWLNYTLAGRNTSSRCLVGLHGHVFDITDFVESHPGSPETLFVQSGRDATWFFEDLGHSVGARKMAMTHCVVLDRGCLEGDKGKGCGLMRTGNRLALKAKPTSQVALPKASWARSQTAKSAMPMLRSKPRRPGTLHRIRAKFDGEGRREQIEAEKWLSRTLTRDGILGNIHVYYDVFLGRWMSWYTGLDFEPVYADSLVDE